MRFVLALALPALLFAQSALLEIKLVGGGGALYLTGSRTAGLTVEVTSELAKPVAGAIVSVRLPNDGPGGSFANGLSSEILTTGSDGRASTSPVHWNQAAGPVEIQLTAMKDRLRAGTVVKCELSDHAAAQQPSTTPHPVPELKRHWPGKWLIIGGAIAVGATTAIATRKSSHSSSGSSQNPSSGALQIGTVTVDIGKP